MLIWRRPFDLALVCFFALAAFTSLVMEPYFVFGVDYHRPGDPFAAGWLLYATSWDPAFVDRPLFLRVICGIDLFVFGPFYLVLIYAFIKRRDWIRLPGLLYASAIVYSTVEYFAWEFIGERSRANLAMVVVCNIPYTVMPLLAAYRLRHPNPFSRSEPGSRDPAAPRAASGEARRLRG
jgi:hypothetical protein